MERRNSANKAFVPYDKGKGELSSPYGDLVIWKEEILLTKLLPL
jgi:hypothetical protein